MVDLIRFRGRERDINIPREVGRHYDMFAYELLGVHSIPHEYMSEDAECTTLEILQAWLEGRGRKPVTWEALVIALHYIGLDELAREIQDVKTTTGTADEPSPTPAPGMMGMCCVGTCVLIGCMLWICTVHTYIVHEQSHA